MSRGTRPYPRGIRPCRLVPLVIQEYAWLALDTPGIRKFSGRSGGASTLSGRELGKRRTRGERRTMRCLAPAVGHGQPCREQRALGVWTTMAARPGAPMPRPERPLETGSDPFLDFARDLRKLRDAAGRPPYRTLAGRAHCSTTTLSQAAAGKRLPSLAYVRACGGDPIEWERRWRDAHALTDPPTDRASVAAESVRAPYLGLSAFRETDTDRFSDVPPCWKRCALNYGGGVWSRCWGRPVRASPHCCAPV